MVVEIDLRLVVVREWCGWLDVCTVVLCMRSADAV